MSHLHIPDGVLPLWLILAGWLATGAILAFVSWRFRNAETGRYLPLLGVMAALMLVGMTVEVVPIAYHINLSVLAGIVLGPLLGFLAALIVDLMLAFFGHGGITVVGLNTLVVGFEAVAGYYLFRAIWSVVRNRQQSPAWSAAAAAVITLALSTTVMIGIVGLSSVGPGSSLPVEQEELGFRNPFDSGLVAVDAGHEGEDEALHSAEAQDGMDLPTFAKLVYALGLLGWLLEGAITGAIVGYVFRLRPDIVRSAHRPRSIQGTSPRS